jgi:hypothetical protein
MLRVFLNHFSCRFRRFRAEKPGLRYAPVRVLPGRTGLFEDCVRNRQSRLAVVVVQIVQKTPDAPKRLPSSHNDGAASRYLPLSA